MTQGNPGVVKVQDRHGLNTGGVVKFKEVCGMEALNGTIHRVTGTQRGVMDAWAGGTSSHDSHVTILISW